jgi:hypothetical protein
MPNNSSKPIANGLRKRTFAISVKGIVNKVICYYKDGHDLLTPSSMKIFKDRISAVPEELLDPANFRLRGKSPRSISVPIVLPVIISQPQLPPMLVESSMNTSIGDVAITGVSTTASGGATGDATAITSLNTTVNTTTTTLPKKVTIKNIQTLQSLTLLLPQKFTVYS